MTSQELIIYAIDKFSAPGASSSGFVSGFLLISSGALWIKKYIINGSINRYFFLKEKEITASCAASQHLEDLSKKLDSVIKEQRKLFDVAEK